MSSNSQQHGGGGGAAAARAEGPLQDGVQLLQPDDSACWMDAAAGIVQDIAAALRLGRDDVQPQSDAANVESLCCRAAAVCGHTAAASAGACGGGSGSQQQQLLSSKALACLHQLSTATMQLAAAVCCEPDVALPLISAGSHAAAMDQLKAAVKSLTSHLLACLELCEQQQQQEAAMVPALGAAAQQLLHMAVTSAGFLAAASSTSTSTGSQQQQAAPREMCSMSALNLSWSNLTRLLVALPEPVRVRVLTPRQLLQGLGCALQQLQAAVADLPVQPRSRQEVLVRFWLQSVSRITSAAWEEAAADAVSPLLDAILQAYVAASSAEFAAAQDILQQLVQPRLMACLSTLLAGSTHAAALSSKLDLLLELPAPAAGGAGDGAAGTQAQQQQQLALRARLMIVLDLLQDCVPAWRPEAVAVACTRLPSWALQTAGSRLGALLLQGGGGSGTSAAAAAVLEQQAPPAGSDGPAAGLQVMQDVQHAVAVGAVACCAALGPCAQQEQLQVLAAITAQALSPHPLVAFLARQLLTDVVALLGSSELDAQLLRTLHKLLAASAAVEALPAGEATLLQGAAAAATTAAAASCDDDGTNGATPQLLATMATLLQACEGQAAAAWVQRHLLQGCPQEASTAGWLHAGACSVLACECALLVRLAGCLPAPLLASWMQPRAGQLWTQLWATSQQALELLDPQQLQQACWQPTAAPGSCSTAPAAAETVLILHQLAWMLQAMHGLMSVVAAGDGSTAQGAAPTPAGSSGSSNADLKAGTVALAWDVLAVLQPAQGSGRSSSSSGTSTAAEAVHACTAAALQVLASAGPLQFAGQQPLARAVEALAALAQATHQRPGVLVLLAGVAGNLGCAAKAGDQHFQALLQQLLGSLLWPVQHAAFDALLRLLRTSACGGSGIVQLLPPHMRSSATEAAPEVIATIKAHLHRQPDPQAQQAYQQASPQLLAQHMQRLASACAHAGGGLTGRRTQARGMQTLQALLADARGVPSCPSPLAPGAGGSGGSGSGGSGSGGSASGGLHAAGGAAAAAHAPQPGARDPHHAAQPLLAQVGAAARSLQAADNALAAAEADVQLLLSAARAASCSHTLGPDAVLLLGKQASSLVGSCASMISRLRSLQEGLATMR